MAGVSYVVFERTFLQTAKAAQIFRAACAIILFVLTQLGLQNKKMKGREAALCPSGVSASRLCQHK